MCPEEKEELQTVDDQLSEQVLESQEDNWLNDLTDQEIGPSTAPDAGIEEEPQKAPDAPKDKPKPEDKKEPPVEDKDKGKEKDWDKERQQRDQERAEQRRREQEQLNSVLQSLANKVSDLEERLAGKGKDDERPKAEDKTGEILEQIDELNEMADAGQVTSAIKGLKGLITKYESKIGQLEKQMAMQGQSISQREQQDQRRQSREELGRMLDDCDKEYGAKHRNQARTSAREALMEAGYTAESPPDSYTVRMALREAYRTARDKDAPKKEPEPAKDRPAVDTGSGGASALGAKTGTRAEVKEQMKKEGKWFNA